MNFKSILIIGCVVLAMFFIGCEKPDFEPYYYDYWGNYYEYEFEKELKEAEAILKEMEREMENLL